MHQTLLWRHVPGLRTLCIATADIHEDFYDDWKHTYYKASTSIQDREKKLDEAAELIETVGIPRLPDIQV